MSTPRLSIDLTPEQVAGLNKYLPHGTKKIIFHLIIDSLLSLCEKHGAGIVIGALIEKAISVRDITGARFGDE